MFIDSIKHYAEFNGGKFLKSILNTRDNKMYYIMKCENNHTFKLQERAIISQGSWCNYCNRSIPELNILKIAAKKKHISVILNKHDFNLYFSCDVCSETWPIFKHNNYLNCPSCNSFKNSSILIDNLNKRLNQYNAKCVSIKCKDKNSVVKIRCYEGHVFGVVYKHAYRSFYCPLCSDFKHESICRNIFESWFMSKFEYSSPYWLVNPKTNSLMEFDGYNTKLKLAFEYYGEQHFRHIKYFHKTKQEFLNLQYRDELKLKLSDENDVNVIIIPYTENYNLKSFILSQLKELNIKIS